MLAPTFVERVLLQVSPRLALNRMRARAAAQTFIRHYEAAQSSWRTENWTRISSDPNAANRAAIGVLRSLAHDLIRNNGWARRGQRVIGNNTVGWGLTPTPVDAGSRALNRATKDFKRWASSPNCDVAGQQNFWSMQRTGIDAIAAGGEVVLRRHWLSRREAQQLGLPIPIQLQLLEADHIDTSKDSVLLPGGGRILQGKEFDANGRLQATWLFPQHPGASFQLGSSQYSGVSQRHPIEDVAATYYIERPGQVRGVTWFCAAIVTLKEFDEFEDAQLLRQKIAACFAAFVTDTDGAGAALGDRTASDPLSETIDPGTIVRLPVGKSVEFGTPPQVVEGTFDERQLRKYAASINVTYEDVTGDYSQVNFSSARMGRLAHWASVNDWQSNMLEPRFCDRAWHWAMEAALLNGNIGETPAAQWTAQPMPMIDPDKEARSDMLRIRSGQATPDQVLIERGLDPSTFWEQYAAQFDQIRARGIVLDSDAKLRSQVGLDPNTNKGAGKKPSA